MAHLDDTLTTSPAGVHGLWVGRLSVGSSRDTQGCWEYTLRYLGQKDGVDEKLSQAFQRLMQYTHGNLDQTDFSFELWLPDEDSACRVRLIALAEWCRGFLEGLISVTGNQLNNLSDDTRELIHDLMEIGDVDVDIDESEQDEREVLELTEFVKVAALNIHLDVQGQRKAFEDACQKADVSTEPKPTLH